jgi:hypothetical protein
MLMFFLMQVLKRFVMRAVYAGAGHNRRLSRRQGATLVDATTVLLDQLRPASKLSRMEAAATLCSLGRPQLLRMLQHTWIVIHSHQAIR